jgi:peptide/nickel transport system substrate-binding protein
MKFDPRPPTNGRSLHSGDVKFSWERFSRISLSRGEAVNAINPDAPIESVLTPDASTVVIKTAEPYAPLLKMLAYSWWIAVYPLEADGGYDPRREMRGSGPWMLTNYKPSVVYEYRKNPNFYDIENRPFLDGKDRHIMPEYASAIAALTGGRIWNYSQGSGTGQSLIRAEDVVPLKRQNPQLMMLANDTLATTKNQYVLVFSGRETSPLRDERVRQAASMLLDRDAFIDTFYNVSDHRRNGLTVETRWESHTPSGFGHYWLDPRGDKLGEGAKFFRHDPAEAKKLLNAAGRFGLETDYTYFLSGGFNGPGGSIARNMEVLRDMLAGEGHFNLKVNVVDYSVFSQRYQNVKADFDGIAVHPSSGFPDIDPWLSSVYTVNGRSSFVKNPLPRVQDLIVQQRRVSDEQKRTAIIHELQRELAIQMPDLPFPGIAQGFDLAWPMLGNYGHYQSYVPLQGGAQEFDTLVWYDKSKQPA